MTSGEYTNPETNKVYVGSSDNIEKRFGVHWAALNAGTHHSEKFQKDFNKLHNPFSRQCKQTDWETLLFRARPYKPPQTNNTNYITKGTIYGR